MKLSSCWVFVEKTRGSAQKRGDSCRTKNTRNTTAAREMNEEVLKIINEADDPYDSDIDMTGITIADVLEEEEVEFE